MKNRMMQKTLLILLAAITASFIFTACGQSDVGDQSAVSESASAASSAPQSGNTSSAAPASFHDLTGGSYDAKTEPPVITEYRTVDDGRAVYAGTCEEGATVYAVKDEKIIAASRSHYGSFLFEIAVHENENPLEFSIYAKRDDKALSDPVPAQAAYYTDYKGISDWVWVGKDFHLFFSATYDNYMRKDTLNSRQYERAKSTISERVQWLNNNLGAKTIYILVPNPNEIYGEYMPDIGKQPDKESLHDQTARLLSEAGAVVIDMKPILEQHKNDAFEIYHRTDSHWTEYAAYFAYQELFNYIAKDFPASAPRPIEDFGFSNERRQAGDLYTDLSMHVENLYETSVYSRLKFPTPVDIPKYKSDISTLIADEPTQERTFENPDGAGKPNVIILRDSYSIMMFDYIAERCAETTLRAMWDFTFDRELFKRKNVDYVIYIVCDMNLKNLYK